MTHGVEFGAPLDALGDGAQEPVFERLDVRVVGADNEGQELAALVGDDLIHDADRAIGAFHRRLLAENEAAFGHVLAFHDRGGRGGGDGWCRRGGWGGS